MRRAVVMFAIVVAVLLLPGIRDVSAQSTTIVKVPFNFVVQGQVLPSGEYRLGVRHGDPSILQIVSTAGETAMFVNVASSEAQKPGNEPTLVFRRIGGGYFLARVNVPGERVREITVPTGAAAAKLAMLATGQPVPKG